MDEVKIHIPIDTDEKLIIRDEIATSLSLSYDVVIIEFDNILLSSVIKIYLHEFTDDEYNFFKELVNLISEKVGDSILLEATKVIRIIGIPEIIEDWAND